MSTHLDLSHGQQVDCRDVLHRCKNSEVARPRMGTLTVARITAVVPTICPSAPSDQPSGTRTP